MFYIVLKYILVQGDSEGKRGKWITKIQEYDIDIKPTKLIKGQGLDKILSEANCQALGINLVTDKEGGSGKGEDQNNIKSSTQIIQLKYIVSQWYKDLFHYLLFF